MQFQQFQNLAFAVTSPTAYDRSDDRPGEFEQFVAISIALTGFSHAELLSTGLVESYFDELALTVGRRIRTVFLGTVAVDPPCALSLDRWRPLGQNLIRMWYVGQWQRLPSTWAQDNFDAEELKEYNEFSRDINRVISPTAYQEGLVWRAIGVNPPGAKQPGFASWTRRL